MKLRVTFNGQTTITNGTLTRTNRSYDDDDDVVAQVNSIKIFFKKKSSQKGMCVIVIKIFFRANHLMGKKEATCFYNIINSIV